MSGRNFALITGASSGIGASFARALAARGQNLVLVARSTDKVRALAQELSRDHPVEALSYSIDLSLPGSPARLAEWLQKDQLDICLLVNNAGFGAQDKFLKVPLELQAQMVRLNIQAVLDLSWLLIPAMVARRAGGVINVSSAVSFQPIPNMATYSATKAFFTSFSMALAHELEGTGVRVVTLCPGTTRTNFFDSGGFSQGGFRRAMQEPSAVVAKALKALDRGGGLVLPRKLDRLMIFVERFLPRRWVVLAAGELFQRQD
ncbi:MAG TPA: SDR family oxidoreductase [Terriglobia bacterium]|nr:SDR family oxidoreductase [Terriglobia bacterium]